MKFNQNSGHEHHELFQFHMNVVTTLLLHIILKLSRVQYSLDKVLTTLPMFLKVGLLYWGCSLEPWKIKNESKQERQNQFNVNYNHLHFRL